MMPLWTWLSSSSPSVASSPASGSAASASLQAQNVGQSAATLTNAQIYQASTQPVFLSNQTSTNAATWVLYNNNVTSSATTAGVFWFDASRDQWIEQEAWVDQQRYLALAQQRAAHCEQTQRVREEQRRLFEQRAAEDYRRHLQTQAERESALTRSRELLLSHLTPRQRKTFLENAWFVVHGGKTETRYRIRTTGYTHNIEILRGERVTHRLCGHLRGDVPLFDHHVAQKLSLEYDEEAFVRLCNRSAA